jgi:MerR family transcriptional regulator, copper efflux regulator
MAATKRIPETPADDELLSIGALARATGVSQRTIRYYEELGILPPPIRSEGGTRRYPPDYKFYVEGALLLKELGFSLDELKLVGRLALGADLTATQRKRALAVIDNKMQALEHRIRVLSRLHYIFDERRKGGANGARLSFAELMRASEDRTSAQSVK